MGHAGTIEHPVDEVVFDPAVIGKSDLEVVQAHAQDRVGFDDLKGRPPDMEAGSSQAFLEMDRGVHQTMEERPTKPSQEHDQGAK